MDLVRRAAHDQVADNPLSHLNVVQRTNDVDALVVERNPRPRRVLDRVLDLAAFASNSTDGSRQVVAGERLNICHIELVHVDVVQADDGERVVDFEAIDERFDEIDSFAHRVRIRSLAARLELDAVNLCVVANVQLQIVDYRVDDRREVVFERRAAIRRNGDFAVVVIVRVLWLVFSCIFRGRLHPESDFV